jgi:hypothetical protein
MYIIFKSFFRYLIINLNRYNTSNGGTAATKIATSFELSQSLDIKCEISTDENNSEVNA